MELKVLVYKLLSLVWTMVIRKLCYFLLAMLKFIIRFFDLHLDVNNQKTTGLTANSLFVSDGVQLVRGECLIINQLFENDPKYRRESSRKDEHDLVKIWDRLGCKNNIRVERDLTKTEMMNALVEFRHRLKVTSPDFMVLVILSHGKRDSKTGMEYIMDINMKGIPFSKIRNMFIDGHKCPSMIGKPKLFFIQACRGIGKQDPENYNSWYKITRNNLRIDTFIFKLK